MLALIFSLASAGDFMDVAITTALEDTNVRAGPEYFSPGPNFVSRGNQTFFENYEGRFTDDISQGHLVLYKRDEGYKAGWWTEAAFVLQYSPYLNPDSTRPGVDLRDDGSYVRIVRDLDDDSNISLTGYAVDASRFRLGYSWDLSYGGREIHTPSVGAVPGARLQYQKGGSYLFAGAKTAINQGTDVEWDVDGDRNTVYYSSLFGGGLTLGEKFRLEGGLGFFQQGESRNGGSAASPLYGQLINAVGTSGQVSFRSSEQLDFIQSSELRLYRNSPDFMRDTYISHNQLDGFGVLVQAEANRLSHNLLDADTAGNTVVETGWAGDVQVRGVMNSTEVAVDFVYKDLEYIVFNVPGLTSGTSIPGSLTTTPQYYGRVTLSHYLPQQHLAASIGAGMMQPASYTDGEGNTYVQYTARNKEQVPDGEPAYNILGSVVGLQYDVSPSTIVVGELLYTLDNNLSRTVDGARVSEPEEVRSALGFNVMIRARF
jgi:hypothetical protein